MVVPYRPRCEAARTDSARAAHGNVSARGYGGAVRFGVLGPLAVWTDAGTPVRVREGKVRALLAVLALNAGAEVPLGRIVEALWEGAAPSDPANTVQTKVSQLRRALEAAEPGARALVVRRGSGYVLDVAGAAVDACRFRLLTAKAAGTRDPHGRVAVFGEALALWRGEPLEEFAQPVLVAEAARLSRQELAAREELAQARLDAGGDLAGLADELAEVVSRHPLRERLRGLHMRALYLAGRQTEALAAFADLRARLAEELGADPGPEIRSLHEAILRHDPALGATAAQREGAGRARAELTRTEQTNLPVPLTGLVGRDTAVEAVRAALRAHRLVTLTGPGGVGKTRLAVEVGTRELPSVRDGVWLVELAGAERDHPGRPVPVERIADALAAALGVQESASRGGRSMLDQLAGALRDRRLLLVVDNCEAVVEPVAAVVSRLLRALPRLRVLATSREPLGVAGEALWEVPALGVPQRPSRPVSPGHDGVHEDHGDAAAVERAVTFSSVRLFMDRATAAVPGFALTPDIVGAVSEICRRLDGLPLALELAATRLRSMGPHELLSRLDDRFRLLTRGPRDMPERQRTLRAVIEWSWRLLDDTERAVLRRLAVHPGGAGLAEAEVVCAGGDVAGEDVAEVLARLVDRSLVVREAHGTATRYRLLESVAAYSLEQLADAGETGTARARHADVYAELASAADHGLRGPGQCCLLGDLDVESANLSAALDTLLGTRQPVAAARLVITLTWYWFLRGRLSTARRALRETLAVMDSETPQAPEAEVVSAWLAGLELLSGHRLARSVGDVADRLGGGRRDGARARALWWLGHALGTVGDLRAAKRATRRALEDFRSCGDRWGIAAALGDLASQRLAVGDLPGAHIAADECSALFAQLGDRWGQLQAAFISGTLAGLHGDDVKAEHGFRTALAMADELGLRPEMSYQTSWLGRVALLRGDLAEARRLHEEALRIATDQGFSPGEMYARTGLALGARREGALEEAQRHLTVLLGWHRDHDAPSSEALILAELGFVAELRGDAEEAMRRQREGLAAARRSRDPRAVALGVEGLAGAEALAGNTRRARRLLAVAARIRAGVGVPLRPGERGDVDRIAARIAEAAAVPAGAR
ncbi:putative ATPase [Saccharomonospora xinjiangensis XJ-54]|uniref:Putative ATPase n=1 Tax=Saccharomonospora xinjiangensis XJ-54 TaxID=882086 RepID=I0V8K7_9PSEU|nr:putative ATPase [Saccharomonospora xinjiangensis XJ-54]